jgi:hypothetical protein
MYSNVLDHGIQGGRHQLMHFFRVSAFDNVGLVPVANEQAFQFLMADAGQHGRIGNFVPVEVQNGKHGTIGDRVKKLVRVPGCGQGTGFGLTVPHHVGDDEVRVVEGRPICVRDGVAKLPPSWIDPGVSGAAWLGMPPGKENCLKSLCIPSASWEILGYTSLYVPSR